MIFAVAASSRAQDAARPPDLAEQVGKKIAAGDVDGAIALARPSARLGDPKARSLLASSLRVAGRFDEACELFLGLVRDGYNDPPNDTVGWNLVRAAYCYEAMGQLASAATSYGRSFSEPDYSGHLARARDGLDRIAKIIRSRPQVMFVEVFGGSAEERAAALEISGLRVGQFPGAADLDQARARLVASKRFKECDVFAWGETRDTQGVLIDVVGTGDPAPAPYAPPRAGHAPPPRDALEASVRMGQAFQSAMSAPGDVELQKALEAAEKQCGAVADRNVDALLATVRDESDTRARAAAEYVLGYATLKDRASEVARTLATDLDAQDDVVRNAALRSIGLIEERFAKALGAPLIDLDAALRGFGRAHVLDRQKAAFLLVLRARDPATRAKLKTLAYDRARAIAATKLSMHRRAGLALLRELEGEKRLGDDEWLAWLKANSPGDVPWWERYGAKSAEQR